MSVLKTYNNYSKWRPPSSLLSIFRRKIRQFHNTMYVVLKRNVKSMFSSVLSTIFYKTFQIKPLWGILVSVVLVCVLNDPHNNRHLTEIIGICLTLKCLIWTYLFLLGIILIQYSSIITLWKRKMTHKAISIKAFARTIWPYYKTRNCLCKKQSNVAPVLENDWVK